MFPLRCVLSYFSPTKRLNHFLATHQNIKNTVCVSLCLLPFSFSGPVVSPPVPSWRDMMMNIMFDCCHTAAAEGVVLVHNLDFSLGCLNHL